MIPISALLTPYEAPPQAPPGMVGNSVRALGASLENRRQFDEQEARQKAQFDANQELQRGQLAETGRYHDILGGYRQDQLAEKKRAADSKTSEKLFDALRKAKTPDEKTRIIAEFKRLGHTVEEGDSDYQPPPGPVDEGKPANTAPAKVQRATVGQNPKDKKARIEPPEFAGYDALAGGESIGKRGATSYATLPDEEGNQTPAVAPGTAPPKRAVPPEIAALVPEGAPGSKPSAPELPKKQGGKFTVRDAEGNIVHEYDAPAEKQKMLTQITAMGAPFVKNAGFPEDEKAATAAAEFASTLVGVIPEDKIPEAYLKAYQENLGGYKKKHIEGQGGGGVPGQPTKLQLKMESMANDETNKIITRVSRDTKIGKAEEAEQASLRALAALDQASSGGMQQLEALKQHMVELSGKVVTDREMSQFMGSTGFWNEVQAKFGKYTAGGQLPPDFLRQLRGVLTTGLKSARSTRSKAGQDAYQEAKLSMPNDPTQWQIARGHFTHNYDEGGPAPARRAPAAPGGGAPAPAAPAPGGGADAAAKAKLDELEKM